jgi:hypothetical protein
MTSKTEIACCGAYCKTCRMKTAPDCKGCKLGYKSGERDINRAKCRIKLCCFRDKNIETCADCNEYKTCQIIKSFHDKSGVKYRKYKEAIDFIKKHDYKEFLKQADNWKGPFGKLTISSKKSK